MYDEANDTMYLLYSKVPGDQTVPRAELYAFLQTIRRLSETQACTVYVDASYVVNGIHHFSNKLAEGLNGDLWAQVYDCFAELRERVSVVNVKSHVKTDEEFSLRSMSSEKIIFNEGADFAADHAVQKLGRSADVIADDSAQFDRELY